MKKDVKLNKEIFWWFGWFFLVVIWNYGYPEASPGEDVLFASLLSIIFIVSKKLKNSNN